MTEEKPLEGAAALAAVESPLAGVNPRSLDALMAEDPAKLSEGEFDQIIAKMRALRVEWLKSEAAKADKPPRAAAGAKPKAAKGTVNINLDDLLGGQNGS